MIQKMLVIVAAAALVGCESGSGGMSSGRQTPPTEEAQLAAFAASNRYPANVQATSDWRGGALIDRKSGSIRIINFSDQPVNQARVWVNASFVHPVSTIPANGFVTLPRSGFYDANGYTLANQAASATKVQIQVDDRLYNTMGPVFE